MPESGSPELLTTSSERQTFTATIEHYGPVFDPDDQNSTAPIKIERRDVSSWIDVTSEFDIVAASLTDPNSREVSITPSTGHEWVSAFYRVSPDDLDCKDVDTTPPVVYESTCPMDSDMDDHYFFTIVTQIGCSASADVNHDGSVTAADFTAWIAAYNAGAPECDQNVDCYCNAADFTAWINNYNNGCL